MFFNEAVVEGTCPTERTVTPAIEGLTVVEIRRGLDCIRQIWASDAFFLVTPMTQFNTDVQHFAVSFVTGQHLKRHKKTVR
jgi:hypothetical protein